ncbi:MAG TPA: sodium:calcium antiporter [Nitrospirae bacterium]|nr:inner membrane protein YrbG [bacterium BMS3Bbin05]HDO21513.1 sodium:calcium antiporter [Nitrospirota bacterium]HDO36388.1 sodium:calcium antiporter [Nitrospirota bacterium]HDZ88185.1 sodium:calcium antiporter [Nitrospirota bacterium]
MLLWLSFIVCTAVIVYSGSRLSKYGDIIAEKSGMGRTWIGLIMLASVTSLPELMTGISSVTVTGVPNIAVGDVLGSCVFNMLIYAVLDVRYRPMPISSRAQQGNILSAAFGILMLGFVAGSIYFGKNVEPLGWIGMYSLIIMIMYFIAIRMVFYYEKRQIALFVKERAVELRYKDVTVKSAVASYSINAVLVIAAAAFLPGIGAGIAEATGLGNTFVGSIFIAISTSLPEVVVSLSAIKMDAIDLAIGNLFGSNIFNVLILAVDDIFFVKGPLLSFVDMSHILSALSAVAMIAVAIIGLTYRASRKPLFLAWDSLGILIIYVVNLLSLYMLK